ncbi:hypothetical protein BCR44DRAFT_1428450 [Catenaria anguillulae PL171]|uniref:Uncharacterized protein n=1 Tax=Catenaria anguillulae PL171 TaxID=765915 RepID=A0A1Y2HV92_9FUNG|nr:hypothetical protein BCR44DRAFT_1428450 [Catenaria anguillulae PL171]
MRKPGTSPSPPQRANNNFTCLQGAPNQHRGKCYQNLKDHNVPLCDPSLATVTMDATGATAAPEAPTSLAAGAVVGIVIGSIVLAGALFMFGVRSIRRQRPGTGSGEPNKGQVSSEAQCKPLVDEDVLYLPGPVIVPLADDGDLFLPGVMFGTSAESAHVELEVEEGKMDDTQEEAKTSVGDVGRRQAQCDVNP